MTVKEIAEFTGKTDRAVRNWIKKATEKSSAIMEKSSASNSSNPADYDIDEVEIILNCSNLGVNAVCIVMANARNKKPIESNGVDYEALTKSITIAVTTALTPLINNIIESKLPQKTTPALPAPKNNRSILRQLVNNYAKDWYFGDHREAWNYLYEELYYRLKVNVRVRAKNEGVSKLDIIESLGYIDQCCLILSEEVK